MTIRIRIRVRVKKRKIIPMRPLKPEGRNTGLIKPALIIGRRLRLIIWIRLIQPARPVGLNSITGRNTIISFQ